MLATAFSSFGEDERVLVFASGVSNSLETRASAFAREESLLRETRRRHPDMVLVYLGTCSVDDPDRGGTPYVQHKLAMEALLERSASPWIVLRLPLAIGSARQAHTLAPYLYERIVRQERFKVWEKATRYPIDVEDAVRIAARLIATPELLGRRINVALRAFHVLDFVRVMESIIGHPATYDLVPKGSHYPISCPEVRALEKALGLDYSEQYIERVLRKYYSRPRPIQ